MSTRYKRTDWVRRREDFSSGAASGFRLGQWLIAGILAIFAGISRLLPVTRWLSVSLTLAVPVVSTVGAGSLKFPAWRGVVFVALVVGMMAMGRGALADLNDGLVAHYPFNGNANDASGNGFDGTVNGAILTEDQFGNPDSAYYL